MLALLGRTTARPIRSLTQEDPLGLAGGLNLYGFTGGDPANFSDPFGLKPDPIKIQWHKVARGKYYASVRITPDDEQRWVNDPKFKGGSVPLGAGPKGWLGQGVCLVSDLNRKTDVEPQEGSQVADIGGRDENTDRTEPATSMRAREDANDLSVAVHADTS